MDELKPKDEIDQIKERYDRRKEISGDLYNPIKNDVIFRKQEFERNLIRILRNNLSYNIQNLNLLEIGCGYGINLLKFLELGFKPENLIGNELLKERVVQARKILPPDIKIIEGDALQLKFEPGTFDIVFQSTVFTSILNEEFKQNLAKKIMNMVKPGGGILWYDFIYSNPNNPDVKGISKKEIKKLFPGAKVHFKKITLAPPLGRAAVKINPSLYHLFNVFTFLRTHLLCWIQKL